MTVKVIEDSTKTPLVVNRALYRSHREFRHSLMEATKRFEHEQMRRAEETLRAQEKSRVNRRASLVMRRGQGMSESSIKGFLKETLDERQKQMDQANRRGGRGRHGRKKTISDMSGMMGGPALPQARAKIQTIVDSTPTKSENLLRNPTKPGEFRKTNYNPFQRRISLSLVESPTREVGVIDTGGNHLTVSGASGATLATELKQHLAGTEAEVAAAAGKDEVLAPTFMPSNGAVFKAQTSL